MRPVKALFAALLALPLMAASALAQAPVKIRIAWVVPVANLPTMLYEKPDLLHFKGKSYDIELVRFQGTPPMITALAAGEIDIALLAYSSLALAIQNAGMDDLRVMADEQREGQPGYYTSPFMVLKDGPIQKVEDLKGKVVASVGQGSAVDIAMRAYLKKHGLEDKRDYSSIEAAFPNMRALLTDKKADLISVVLPFSINPDLVAKGRVLFTVKDSLGTSDFLVWAAKDAFLKKNKAALTDFMEDTIRSLRYLQDPANRDYLLKTAARVSKLPEAAFADWLYTHKDLYRDPDMLPDLDALQRSIDVQQSLGLLREKLDIRKYVDLGVTQDAAKRLKK
jgi:NitT/TauT family transport system substrate-binding protein